MTTLEELDAVKFAAEKATYDAAKALADEMLVDIAIPAVRLALSGLAVKAVHEYRTRAEAWEKASQAFLDHAQRTELNERTEP